MTELHLLKISSELGIAPWSVQAAAHLLAEGATVPFIARYRKEVTGSLDEVAVMAIRDRIAQLEELEARRSSILESLKDRQLLTEALEVAIQSAETLSRLEDIYLPFRPKRRTRAMIARERRLEPLADWLLANQEADPHAEASRFVSADQEVENSDAALAGARDIIAERLSDHPDMRALVRGIFEKEGILSSKVMYGQEEAGAKYRDYFDWAEPAAKAPSHRILAIRRGAQEGHLYFTIQPPQERVLPQLEQAWVSGTGGAAGQVRLAVQDGYKRLLAPSIETEIRVATKKRADRDAIAVFADNVRELLLASPLGRKRVLALDPGLRTGCKLVCLDEQGHLVHDDVLYLIQGAARVEEARNKLLAYTSRFGIEAIAIGNGTASRETEAFVRSVGLPSSIVIVMVNESGASVYSASEVARDEFPDKDITVRGAVSIGRRLMDPLAELVKIDPQSIGVGQYQHDVDPRELKQSLDDVVISCVNKVGVEINTASKQLLAYVSGLNDRIAGNIVEHRRQHGPFRNRRDLLQVSGLGPKTFEQAAGFLRLRDSTHPLDASAVHPESYQVVERMAADLKVDVPALIESVALRQRIRLEAYIDERIGLPTLQDILSELEKPGRDPRRQFEAFTFAEEVHAISDLKVGMKLPGIVTNVAAFGAFVDIGVHQDGLVHVSQLADHFVKDPAQIVKVQQTVQVTVIDVDLPRKRIQLSMMSKPDFAGKRSEGPASPGPRTRAPQRGATSDNWFDAAIKSNKRGR